MYMIHTEMFRNPEFYSTLREAHDAAEKEASKDYDGEIRYVVEVVEAIKPDIPKFPTVTVNTSQLTIEEIKKLGKQDNED